MDAASRLAGRLDRWCGLGGDIDSRERAAAAAAVLAEMETTLAANGTADVPRSDWESCLSATRHPAFLLALDSDDARRRWAECTFRIVEGIGFSLGDLLTQRACEHPDRPFLQEAAETGNCWSYAQVRREARATAALFLSESPRPDPVPAGDPVTGAAVDSPRVALFCGNSVAAACCDLACLAHDILVTPLSVQLLVADLTWIFDRLAVTVAVCDHPDRLGTLLAVRSQARRTFLIYTLFEGESTGDPGVRSLAERRGLLETVQVEAILAARPRRGLRDVATVMFTSGSTGRPKGVAFSQYALVTKRFARAAALPAVGEGEVLLCYLPLFHTFGRFLELLGMLFWGGTYVFAGNPSTATLLNQLREVRPTGLISVPARWLRLRDRVRELADDANGAAATPELVHSVVGDRLRWGLSAAGHLDPAVFRFFQRAGIELCSGFGMTEGTGGLTMTPPGRYVDNSVGVPLPGVRVRFSDEGELQIAGPYVARYLPEPAPAGSLRVPEADSDDHWLATGDLFRRTPDGYLEIVDRIKDIYKNDRGQTVAPHVVESQFETVPGIVRTFLVGDGRSYNTLLIVPDEDSDVLRSLALPQSRREYFDRIVTTANSGLAPFERVVDFAVLERDFSVAHGELTPKGSMRRKVIEQGFAGTIAGLYRSGSRTLNVGNYEVRVPRWFYRDLGLLDDALRVEPGALVNRHDGRRLVIAPGAAGRVRIGDLEYQLDGSAIDLGLLVSQPLLWVANAPLIDFGPCRPDWDRETAPFSEQVTLPADILRESEPLCDPGRVDPQLRIVDSLCRQALFGLPTLALAAVAGLDAELGRVGQRRGKVVRRRLEALAGHPDYTVRCRAYQALVLDQPVPDPHTYLPSFIDSGLPFFDEETVRAVTRAGIEPRRLQALRQRLYWYRTQLAWPAQPQTRVVLEGLLHLLSHYGAHHPAYYCPIREELVAWCLHEADPDLARAAARALAHLEESFEEQLTLDGDSLDVDAWRSRLVFEDGLEPAETERLRRVLLGTTFLRHTMRVVFEGEDLRLADVAPGGIWASRLSSRHSDSRYRLSINTRAGKHFDILLIMRDDLNQARVLQTIMWTVALRGYPFGVAILPALGCCRPGLGAVSMAYHSDLTVWEKIRELSSVRGPGTVPPTQMRWRQLLVRAMAVVIRGWNNSGRQIIPGLVSPANIVVPEPDFRLGAQIISLSGWREYHGPLSLMRPLWRNFYRHTISHYPRTAGDLEREWIFEAVVEALGLDDAIAWLAELREELAVSDDGEFGSGFAEALVTFVDGLRDHFHQPMDLKAAINRFGDWQAVNEQAPLPARLEVIDELSQLYRLGRLPDLVRLTLFRHTYFAGADARVHEAFDRLLERRFRQSGQRAAQMVELSDLQAALTKADDLVAFNRMAFPHRQPDDNVEVRAVGDPGQGRVILRTTIHDRHGRAYVVSQPAGPADVGHLYRQFLLAGYPKGITSTDRYLVASDGSEQIVGGAVYRETDVESLFLDGIAVSSALADRDLEAAILADLCTRVRALGFRTLKTHFFLRSFYEDHGFRLDQQRGGLVRRL